jgi:hypothetical protein
MAKKGQAMGHSFYKNSEDLHLSAGNYAGGACLTGHHSHWEPRNSCSYRWQGLKKAESIKSVYNSHEKKSAHLGKSGFGWARAESVDAGKAGKVLRKFETEMKKDKLKTKIEAQNFTNGFAPYSNQVHHVLPNSVLRNGIDKTVNGDADLVKDICDGLLTEKYNINYQDNMIILPVDWEDACQIGLPTHNGDHPTYRAEIQTAVLEALAPYQQAANQGESHEEPDYEEIKEKLETISKDMYDSIKNYGQTAIKGKCASGEVGVNNLPKSVYGAPGL